MYDNDEIMELRYIVSTSSFDELKNLVREQNKRLNRILDICDAVLETETHDHLEFFKWLVSELGQHLSLAAYDNYLVRCAAENRRLEVVKWLLCEILTES